ncbi:hypothetical protein [Paraferrimonas sp. SM1919]|uniref:hypothetical protein n=1 Tax=Paraferrimonas sp. SM1919 TaxID=2662263 RepID=UPI0013D0E137|nr:hypothetical protein [Paraferrimonas sp. SM1919]
MKTIMKIAALTAAVASLSACHTHTNPQTDFMAKLNALCGQSFEGKVVTTDKADSGFASERLVMHVKECSTERMAIPFNVGENRSRTWLITKTDNGLRLKHDHRHEDGSHDEVTMYGGDTETLGSANKQSFPVDQFSIDMFNKTGLTASVTNVWHVHIDDNTFSYQLTRENRNFKVDFDLSQPVATPAASWGH